MTKEEKQLLLIDLCARLPYGVIVKENDGVNENDNKLLDIDMFDGCINYDYIIEDIKPYLRSMESITEEEKDELYTNIEWCADIDENGNFIIYKYTGSKIYRSTITGYVSWLLAHHFDFNNLIEKGLALEAPDGMYK